MSEEVKTNNDIYGLLQTLTENNKRIEDRLERIETSICKEVKVIQERIESLEEENKKLKNQLLDTQKRQRKYNLVIYGVSESETNLSLAVEDIIKSKLEVAIEISEIRDLFRLGKLNENKKSRPILIELVSYSKKLDILKNSAKLKGTGLYISKDYTEEELKDRKILVNQLKQAREQHYQAKIYKNKLVINGEIYGVEDFKNNHQVDEVDAQGPSLKIIERNGVPVVALSKGEEINEGQNSLKSSITGEESTGRILRGNVSSNRGLDKKRPIAEEKEQKDSKKKKN